MLTGLQVYEGQVDGPLGARDLCKGGATEPEPLQLLQKLCYAAKPGSDCLQGKRVQRSRVRQQSALLVALCF